MKILILKPSSLGDVVQALPVLRLLKRHWAESEIFWWIDSTLAPLLEGDPDLAGIVRFERRRWASPLHWNEVWESVQQLRRHAFDVVIDLQCLARSGIFAWLANGGLLIGLDEAREGARGFYDIAVRRASFHTHAVDWYLEVLKVLGVPANGDFTWLPQRADIAAGVRRKWQTEGHRWVVMQPGARWLNKRWPVQHFASVLRNISAAHPEFRFAILGADSDRELGAALSGPTLPASLDLTGKLSLPEMVEWIRLSDLMISNDTGPMHVAAALGKPLVSIFGPTEPRRTGPYHQADSVLQARIPCVPCLKPHCHNPIPLECLESVSPVMVQAKAEDHLRLARSTGISKVI